MADEVDRHDDAEQQERADAPRGGVAAAVLRRVREDPHRRRGCDCHGDDERAVFAELCDIVEEVVALYRADGRPLPPMTSGRDLANKLQDVA